MTQKLQWTIRFTVRDEVKMLAYAREVAKEHGDSDYLEEMLAQDAEEVERGETTLGMTAMEYLIEAGGPCYHAPPDNRDVGFTWDGNVGGQSE